MKTLLFYICTFMLVSFAIGLRKLGAGNENYSACLTENNVSNDDMLFMQDVVHGKHKLSENQEKINKNGCILQCLFQKAGVMEGSEYNVEKMHIDFTKRTSAGPGTRIFEALDNCINETKDLTEKCDKAFALTECFLKAENRIFTSDSNEEHKNEHESRK